MAKELSNLLEKKMNGLFVVEDDVTYKIIGAYFYHGHYCPEVKDAEGYCSMLNDVSEAKVASPAQIKKFKSEERKNKKESSSRRDSRLYVPTGFLDNGVF